MNLPEDPVMLYSVINLKLRDFYPSLDILCEEMEADRKQIEEILRGAGFTYNEVTNRFE